MPHPLSEKITRRLDENENKDPHARTTITNAEAVEIRDELNWMFDYYSHIHCATPGNIDTCRECGRDIRHPIHKRSEVAS